MQCNSCLRPRHTDDCGHGAALRSTCGKYGAVPDLFEAAQLTFKVSLAHAQAVSVPTEKGDKVEEQLRRDGRVTGLAWEEDADAGSDHAARSDESYFKAGLPDGSKTVHGMKPGKQFNLQFGPDAIGLAFEGDLS